MDFTENDFELSEHYERKIRKSSSLLFKTGILKHNTMYIAPKKFYGGSNTTIG